MKSCARQAGGGDHAFHGNRGVGKRDVLADRAVEQHILLQHDPHLAAQPGRIDQGEIDTIDRPLSGT